MYNGTGRRFTIPQHNERTMSIQSGPHFELHSAELAAWIEEQGTAVWWNVDGETVLTDRVAFPCPGDELAEELRRLNRLLLIQDPQNRDIADGREVGAAELDSLVDILGNNVKYEGEKPVWADDRILYCCWKDTGEEWLLSEDKETSKSNEQDELSLRSKK